MECEPERHLALPPLITMRRALLKWVDLPAARIVNGWDTSHSYNP